MKILTVLIYTAFLIASYWHLFLCFVLLSPSPIAAALLAGGFELFLWFSSFMYAYFIEKSKWKEANQISWMAKTGVGVVWLGNWIAIQKHFMTINLGFVIFGKDISELLKWLIPFIVSLYIPIGTLGLGQLLGVVVQDRRVNIQRWIEKNYTKYENAQQLKKAIIDEFGVDLNIRKLTKFYQKPKKQRNLRRRSALKT